LCHHVLDPDQRRIVAKRAKWIYPGHSERSYSNRRRGWAMDFEFRESCPIVNQSLCGTGRLEFIEEDARRREPPACISISGIDWIDRHRRVMTSW
jgi:hypothetical protein